MGIIIIVSNIKLVYKCFGRHVFIYLGCVPKGIMQAFMSRCVYTIRVCIYMFIYIYVHMGVPM